MERARKILKPVLDPYKIQKKIASTSAKTNVIAVSYPPTKFKRK